MANTTTNCGLLKLDIRILNFWTVILLGIFAEFTSIDWVYKFHIHICFERISGPQCGKSNTKVADCVRSQKRLPSYTHYVVTRILGMNPQLLTKDSFTRILIVQ